MLILCLVRFLCAMAHSLSRVSNYCGLPVSILVDPEALAAVPATAHWQRQDVTNVDNATVLWLVPLNILCDTL